MWFSSLQVYRLTKPFELTAEALEQQLQNGAFQPCGPLTPASYGWVSPLGRHGEQLTHIANGNIMLCARREDKILPASVIRELLNEKVAEIEAAQARPVRRKERETLREELMHDLLPKAFSRSTLTYAYISPKDNLIVVDASSPKKAEDLLSYLRRTIGSLSSQPIRVKSAPASVMTQWLQGVEVPQDIVIKDECELHEPGDEGGIVRCKRQDLGSEEIQAHINAGKQVVKLAVGWETTLSCVLCDDLSIKRLRFDDQILEQSKEIDSDDYRAHFDNDFTVMALELSRLIPRILEVFGGEDDTAYAR